MKKEIFSLVWFSSLFYHHLLRAHQTSWHKIWWFYFSLHYKCKQTDRFSVDTINSNRAYLEVSLCISVIYQFLYSWSEGAIFWLYIWSTWRILFNLWWCQENPGTHESCVHDHGNTVMRVCHVNSCIFVLSHITMKWDYVHSALMRIRRKKPWQKRELFIRAYVHIDTD